MPGTVGVGRRSSLLSRGKYGRAVRRGATAGIDRANQINDDRVARATSTWRERKGNERMILIENWTCLNTCDTLVVTPVDVLFLLSGMAALAQRVVNCDDVGIVNGEWGGWIRSVRSLRWNHLIICFLFCFLTTRF